MLSLTAARHFLGRMDELDEEARVREHAVARTWLWAQEEELSELFLAEGRSDLPVEDYAAWRQGQQRRPEMRAWNGRPRCVRRVGGWAGRGVDPSRTCGLT